MAVTFGGASGDHLLDEPVPVRVTGCAPGAPVLVTVSSVDRDGVEHVAWAEFAADRGGTVDPVRHAPLAGTYAGPDPFGLWWSMRGGGAGAAPDDRPFRLGPDPIPTTVSVCVDGGTADTRTFPRRWDAPGGVRSEVRDGGLDAAYFRPPPGCPIPAPGVVVLGGSEGGRSAAEHVAGLLAARGLPALALAYFGVPGLPQRLSDVPVEYVGDAIEVLSRLPEVDGARIAVLGSSRGGELALLAASHCKRIGAVVGYSASGTVWPGVGEAGTATTAWTLRGRPLPHSSPAASGSGEPVRSRATFLPLAAVADAAAIPVERIAGPVLLFSGGDDQMWPSDVFADQLLARRRAAGGPWSDEHHRCPGAGHLAARPPGLPAARNSVVHPADGRRHALGGAAAPNGRAAVVCWTRAVGFLHTAWSRR